MNKLLKIVIFFGVVFGIYAEPPLLWVDIPMPRLKSITIIHIGDEDAPVQESLFDEIINLINENRILFEENLRVGRGYEYGCYQLFIEDEDKGDKYYLFLDERKKSIIFFKKLNEIVMKKKFYDTFKKQLEILINSIDV